VTSVGIVSERPPVDAGGLRSISGLVRDWALRTPDAVAVLDLDGRALTFSGLAAQLDLVELELRALGVGPDQRVAVVLPDGPELATAFLGLASSAACAPLNPAYREQELAFYLSDLGASAVVVGRDARSTAARNAAERLGLLTLELQALEDGAGTFTLRRASGATRDLPTRHEPAALLLHTSGTTARPKLVPLSQANLCASARAVAASLELTPDDRCLAVMPLFHIHGLVASVLAPVASGSTVVCTTGFDATRFHAWLEALRPSWYTAVPTMHMAVLERARGDSVASRGGLRLVRSSSAALPAPVSEGLEDLFGCPAIEAYGMTEAAHQMASNPLPPEERKRGSVGRAAGPEIAVLDEEGRELEAGEVGEVSIRGPNVFSGYERNPEANRDSFAGGWFRTGDQGYLDGDGYLFLRGRLKEIINRGGEKVSPREIEDAVLAHPAVADAVAFAQPHARLGEDVAAAVVLRGAPGPDTEEIQRFLASRLAPFKVPATVVFLAELPKGPTGKVQRVGMAERLGLPALGASRGRRAEFAAPRTTLEERLCRLWEELLEIERVGIHDDFIALGGDSLLVAQLLAQLAEEGEPEIAATAASLPASCILWAPTVERLAALLEEGWEAHGGLVPVEPGREGRPFYFFPAHDWATVGLGALSRRLEGEFALHTYELDAGTSPEEVRSVEALASRIVTEIRALQPEGPYVLGGVCFGGALALELGRRLRADGEQVSLLLVNPIGERPGRRRARLRWLARTARSGTLLAWARRRTHRQGTPADPQQWPVTVLGLQLAIEEASQTYRAHPYAGPVTVLAGADYTTPKRFWTRTAPGGLDWRPVPHGSAAVFRTRHLDALAAELSDVLAHS
jgi:acyl-CoA synthetase (AMP-forming)/AMP-acid ligase II